MDSSPDNFIVAGIVGFVLIGLGVGAIIVIPAILFLLAVLKAF